MIDTVVLRIHGCEKYSHICKHLIQLNSKDYVKKFKHNGLQDSSKDAILYSDTGRILDVSHRSSINIASSHYSISFLIHKERDFIELNFSIPKYVHSTNVLQFVDQHDTGVKHTYQKFLALMVDFFNKYLPLPPDWHDVEINRIDICFNQFFLSKKDALRYLEEQRTLNIDYARSEKNRFQSYGTTTVQYLTDNYSFKIYHKGTEFIKNDYGRLAKNNPKNLNLAELRDISDRILRYEMSAKKGLLNYLFKQRLKDDINTMFNHNYGRLQKLRNKASQEFINKTLPNKTFSFTLKSHWDNPQKPPIELFQDFNLPFNFELFEQLNLFFWERVRKYQLGVKMGIKEIHDKIKEHQETKDITNKLYGKREKIAQTGQLLLLATLSQYTDVSDLKEVLPTATYYRYIKKLESLGIPKHSPDIAVKPPPLDFSDYFFYFGKYHLTYN